MTRDELKQLIVGPVVAVPTPFDDDFKVDLGRMAAATQFWVENGLVAGKAVIKVAAIAGEGPMLRDDEWPPLLRTVVQTANGKAAIMCGISYKDTKRTIADAKRAQDLGAIGLQITPPIFNSPTQDDLLRFFGDLSDAIDIGIMVYNNPWYAGGNVETETLLKMADMENVVAVKWNTWGSPEGQNYEDMTKFAHIFNVIDNTVDPVRCHKLGGRGYIQTAAFCYPPHDLHIWELIENRQYDEAQAKFEKVILATRELSGKFNKRSGGMRLGKSMMALMGIPMGSARPPSLPLNDEETAELRALLLSFGWPVKA